MVTSITNSGIPLWQLCRKINKMTTEQINFIPRLGAIAPDFEAVTTTGRMNFGEFVKGKWALLFSHPADFTTVCTTEMSGFTKRKPDFSALDTLLVGLSIDSIHSHLAWGNNIRE